MEDYLRRYIATLEERSRRHEQTIEELAEEAGAGQHWKKCAKRDAAALVLSNAALAEAILHLDEDTEAYELCRVALGWEQEPTEREVEHRWRRRVAKERRELRRDLEAAS